QLAKASESLQIPATAQTILAARIDRLEPEDKRLLQAASVIGKDIPFVLLRAIADGSEDSIRGSLSNLQTAEFIYETRLFPNLEYTFRHALTHEVTYSCVLQERRRALHASIVAVIERLFAGRIEEQVERLAYHAQQGELWEKAFAYCRAAGNKAVGRGTYREALGMLEGAQRALGRLAERREVQEWQIDLRLEFQPVFNALGDLNRMLQLLFEAERPAEALGDQHRLARVLAYTGRCFWWMGLPSRSVQAGERALAMAIAISDVTLEVVANYHLGLACFLAGDFARTIKVYRRIEVILNGPLQNERFGMPAMPLVIARAWRSYSHACLGQFDEAAVVSLDTVRIAQSVDHGYSIVVALEGAGLVEIVRGNLAAAVSWLERAAELARDGGFAVLLSLAMSALGRTATLLGRTD